jgi:hypothetical protein
MQLYIYRNNSQSGPHDEEVVKGQLRTGGLSASDLGCRVGETQWVPLRELFPDAIPQASPQTPGGVPAAAAKKPGGCRVPLGWTMVVVGLLLFFGALALAVATPFVYSMPLCPIAETDHARLEDLKKKYDAAGPDEKILEEQEVKRAIDDYDSSSRLCAEERGTRQLFIVGSGVVSVFGFFLAVIGFFVRRVRQTPS